MPGLGFVIEILRLRRLYEFEDVHICLRSEDGEEHSGDLLVMFDKESWGAWYPK